MHLQPALLISILAIGVSATYRVDGTNYGSESDLIVAPQVPGARVTNDIYNHCNETNEGGEQISDGEECFGNALQYMVQALSDAHNVKQMVALLSNTVSGVQSLALGPVNSTATASRSSLDSIPSATESMLPKLKRQSGNVLEAALDELNDQILRRSEGRRRPRAVQIGHSDVHPTDGLAIRTNVRSGDATLHVHTNGSHAIAAFENDAFPPLDRRDASFTPGPVYRFEGAQGLKLQIEVADAQAYSVLSTLLSTLAHGEGEMAPKLKESDSWGFVLCGKLNKEMMLQGKLVAEDDGAGYDREIEGLIDCTA